MRRLKEILVALDGSSGAFHALQESMRLARWAKGRVTAIAVAPSFEGDLSLVGVRNPKAVVEGQSGEILSRAFRMAASSEMEIAVICEEGEIDQRIACRARDGGFELIVVGREARQTFRHLLFSTMPVALASRSAVDILVVPEPVEIRWERALYLDWQSDADPRAFSRSVDICEAYGAVLLPARLDFTQGRNAELVVCEPIPPMSGAGSKEKKRRSMPRSMPKEVSRQPPGTRDLAKAVGRKHAEESAGMLFVPYRPVQGIGGWVTRRFLDRLILESPCPVLILKA